jgi:Leucine-rich repeat (LRR) protein
MFNLKLIFWLGFVIIARGSSAQKLLTCQAKGRDFCRIYSADILENDTISIKISGENVTSEEIKKVGFSDSSFFMIPQELFSTFKNLEILDMYGCDLKTIKPDTFAEAENLKILKLYSNNLVEIQPEMFEGLEHLKELYLSFNKIKKFQKNVFQHLNNLEILDIGGNEIHELYEDTFNSQTRLKKIILDFNHLEYLPKNLFRKNANLESISIFGNQLEAMSNRMFHPRNFPKLRFIGFQVNNCISQVYHNFQDEFVQIRKDLVDCMTGYLLYEDQYKDEKIDLLEERIGELGECLAVMNERIENIENILEELTNKN